MRSSRQTSFILGGLLGTISLLLTACATPATYSSTLEPINMSSKPTVIALPRVFFVERPNAFCDADIGDEFHWHLRRELERKGYRVVPADAPPMENVNRPEELATAPAGAMQNLLTGDAQAILRVRIDRYLALDLCSAEAIRTLEVTGTAELFDRALDHPVWRHAAKAGDTSVSRHENLPFRVAAELSRQLLAPLPPATGPAP